MEIPVALQFMYYLPARDPDVDMSKEPITRIMETAAAEEVEEEWKCIKRR